jgi:hypothetical protein
MFVYLLTYNKPIYIFFDNLQLIELCNNTHTLFGCYYMNNPNKITFLERLFVNYKTKDEQTTINKLIDEKYMAMISATESSKTKSKKKTKKDKQVAKKLSTQRGRSPVRDIVKSQKHSTKSKSHSRDRRSRSPSRNRTRSRSHSRDRSRSHSRDRRSRSRHYHSYRHYHSRSRSSSRSKSPTHRVSQPNIYYLQVPPELMNPQFMSLFGKTSHPYIDESSVYFK